MTSLASSSLLGSFHSAGYVTYQFCPGVNYKNYNSDDYNRITMAGQNMAAGLIMAWMTLE